MTTYFIVCDECFKSLSDLGIAQEVYCLIVNNFLYTHKAIKIDKSWKSIATFLEKKGFIITHEMQNYTFALPIIMPCENTYMLGKRCHKCE